jgi:hypothetical protein
LATSNECQNDENVNAADVRSAEDSNNDKWKETYSARNYEKFFFVKYHIHLEATPNSPKIFVRQFIHLSGLNELLTSILDKCDSHMQGIHHATLE